MASLQLALPLLPLPAVFLKHIIALSIYRYGSYVCDCGSEREPLRGHRLCLQMLLFLLLLLLFTAAAVVTVVIVVFLVRCGPSLVMAILAARAAAASGITATATATP